MQNKRLQYNISDWSQSTKCLSNNSKSLYITVDKYINNADFQGKVVKVNHSTLGVLFAAVVNGSGSIVSDTDDDSFQLEWLDTSQILEQLEKFGFDITYREDIHLPGGQLTLLSKLWELGYDKLTKVSVSVDAKIIRTYVVGFRSDKALELLTWGLKISVQKFQKMCADGYVINIDSMSESSFSWSWLIHVFNISDILDANSEVYIPEKPKYPVGEPATNVPIGLEEMNEGLHIYEPEDSDSSEDSGESEVDDVE